MRQVHQQEFRGFQFPCLDQYPSLRHVFAGRSDSDSGNLALSGERDRIAALSARQAWSDFLSVDAQDWVVGGQVHTSTVRVVDDSHRGRGALTPESVLPHCDGLITQAVGLPLYVAVADCSAVLLHAPGVLAVVHGGWRGLARGILQNAVTQMEELGYRSDSLVAAIAPCIAAASYEVGPEVGDAAPEVARYRGRADRWQVDIALWAEWCLNQAGLNPTDIHQSGIDTGSISTCFSHRRQGPGAGRNGLIAVLRA